MIHGFDGTAVMVIRYGMVPYRGMNKGVRCVFSNRTSGRVSTESEKPMRLCLFFHGIIRCGLLSCRRSLFARSNACPRLVHDITHDLVTCGDSRCQQVNGLFNLYPSILFLFRGRILHACLEESRLPLRLNLLDPLHGLQGLSHKFSIVLDGSISSFFKLKGRVDCHFFPPGLAVGLGPSHFAGISLFMKGPGAFGTTKAKRLAVVTDKHGAVSRIARTRAEITLFNAHGGVAVAVSVATAVGTGGLLMYRNTK